MKKITRASSINSTSNASEIENYDLMRVRHKFDEEDAYKSRIDRKVR